MDWLHPCSPLLNSSHFRWFISCLGIILEADWLLVNLPVSWCEIPWFIIFSRECSCFTMFLWLNSPFFYLLHHCLWLNHNFSMIKSPFPMVKSPFVMVKHGKIIIFHGKITISRGKITISHGKITIFYGKIAIFVSAPRCPRLWSTSGSASRCLAGAWQPWTRSGQRRCYWLQGKMGGFLESPWEIYIYIYIWGFPYIWGYPKWDGFQWKILLRWMI